MSFHDYKTIPHYSPSAEADSPSRKEGKSQRKNLRNITRGANIITDASHTLTPIYIMY